MSISDLKGNIWSIYFVVLIKFIAVMCSVYGTEKNKLDKEFDLKCE